MLTCGFPKKKKEAGCDWMKKKLGHVRSPAEIQFWLWWQQQMGNL